VFIPSATSRGLSMHLWFIEQTAHAIANGYWVGTINRVGVEGEELLRRDGTRAGEQRRLKQLR